MNDWPEIVIVMLTWAGPPELNIAKKRLDQAKRTVASLKKHFIYPNYSWHIADDGSPEWYQKEIQEIMEGEDYTFTDTKKGWDMNNNWNTGMAAAFERADIIAGWPDDRFLNKDLDVKSYVRLLTEHDDICYIRLTGETVGLRSERITRVGKQWRLLDKKSKSRHVFLCFCFMMHKRWIEHYGYFTPDLWPVSEAENCTDAQFRKTPGPGAVIPEDLWKGFIPWGDFSTWEKPKGGVYRDTPPPIEERRRHE